MPSPATVRGLLISYGITDRSQLDRWADLARDTDRDDRWLPAGLPDRLLEYTGLEMEAQQIRTFGGMLIPGLLQTRAYAAEVMKGSVQRIEEAGVRHRLEARLCRQARLSSPDPPQLHAIIDEHTLRRPIGVGIIREQCEHICDLLKRPDLDLTLQVMPVSVGLPPGPGSLNILDYPDTGLAIATVDTAIGEIVLHRPEDLRLATNIWQGLESHSLDTKQSQAVLESIISHQE